MIAFLKGTLEAKTHQEAYIDVEGVGYKVLMSTKSLELLPPVKSHVFVYTYLQVREDAMSLFGFVSPEEKALFEKLIGVSGIGPKVALAVLSAYSPDVFISHIAEQNITALQKIPGIGKKSASRMVLELKGSFDHESDTLFSRGAPVYQNTGLAQAREALMSMGFTSTETELSLKGAPDGADEVVLIQYALKQLGK